MVGSNLPPPLFLRRIYRKRRPQSWPSFFFAIKNSDFFVKFCRNMWRFGTFISNLMNAAKISLLKILINGLSKSNLCYFLKTFFTVNLFLFNIQFLSSLRIQTKHKLQSTYHGEDSCHQ